MLKTFYWDPECFGETQRCLKMMLEINSRVNFCGLDPGGRPLALYYYDPDDNDEVMRHCWLKEQVSAEYLSCDVYGGFNLFPLLRVQDEDNRLKIEQLNDHNIVILHSNDQPLYCIPTGEVKQLSKEEELLLKEINAVIIFKESWAFLGILEDFESVSIHSLHSDLAQVHLSNHLRELSYSTFNTQVSTVPETVQRLYVRGGLLKDLDVTKLQSLRRLELRDIKKGSTLIFDPNHPPPLEELVTEKTQLYQSILSAIDTSHLVNLQLDQVTLSADDLEVIKRCTHLKVLKLESKKKNKYAIDQLFRGLKHLETLSLSKIKLITDWSDLKQLSRLRALALSECADISTALVQVHSAPELKHIYINQCPDPKDTTIELAQLSLDRLWLTEINALETLTLKEVSAHDVIIRDHPQLTTLSIEDGFQCERLRISNCAQLTTIHIPSTAQIDELIITHCPHLSRLPHLGSSLHTIHLEKLQDLNEMTQIKDAVDLQSVCLLELPKIRDPEAALSDLSCLRELTWHEPDLRAYILAKSALIQPDVDWIQHEFDHWLKVMDQYHAPLNMLNILSECLIAVLDHAQREWVDLRVTQLLNIGNVIHADAGQHIWQKWIELAMHSEHRVTYLRELINLDRIDQAAQMPETMTRSIKSQRLDQVIYAYHRLDLAFDELPTVIFEWVNTLGQHQTDDPRFSLQYFDEALLQESVNAFKVWDQISVFEPSTLQVWGGPEQIVTSSDEGVLIKDHGLIPIHEPEALSFQIHRGGSLLICKRGQPIASLLKNHQYAHQASKVIMITGEQPRLNQRESIECESLLFCDEVTASEDWSQWTHVKSVSLSNISNYTRFGQFKNLETLKLAGSGSVDHVDLSGCQRLIELDTIDFKNTSDTRLMVPQDLKPQTVRLGRGCRPEDLNVEDLENLETYDSGFEGLKLTAEHFKKIKRLSLKNESRLVHLTVDGIESLYEISLEGSTNLIEIRLHNLPALQTFEAPLTDPGYTDEDEIQFFDGSTTYLNELSLSRLPQLESLSLMSYVDEYDSRKDDRVRIQINELENLKSLNTSGNSQWIHTVSHCPNLQKIDVSGLVESISLIELNRLESLHIGECLEAPHFTGRFDHLKDVKMSCPQMTSVKPLLKYSSLETLDLQGSTSILDLESLSSLTQLSELSWIQRGRSESVLISTAYQRRDHEWVAHHIEEVIDVFHMGLHKEQFFIDILNALSLLTEQDPAYLTKLLDLGRDDDTAPLNTHAWSLWAKRALELPQHAREECIKEALSSCDGAEDAEHRVSVLIHALAPPSDAESHWVTEAVEACLARLIEADLARYIISPAALFYAHRDQRLKVDEWLERGVALDSPQWLEVTYRDLALYAAKSEAWSEMDEWVEKITKSSLKAQTHGLLCEHLIAEHPKRALHHLTLMGNTPERAKYALKLAERVRDHENLLVLPKLIASLTDQPEPLFELLRQEMQSSDEVREELQMLRGEGTMDAREVVMNALGDPLLQDQLRPKDFRTLKADLTEMLETQKHSDVMRRLLVRGLLAESMLKQYIDVEDFEELNREV